MKSCLFVSGIQHTTTHKKRICTWLIPLPRWKASELPIKASESTISLASILMDSGNGNSDEFFLLVQETSKKEDPDTGQRKGTYLLTTKGIKYWGGGESYREIFRWNHICVSVRYKNGKAHRRIFVDGQLHFDISSDFLSSTIWPSNRFFTVGGREFKYGGQTNLKGSITDVQLFSKFLSDSEMQEYTLCIQVSFVLYKINMFEQGIFRS